MILTSFGFKYAENICELKDGKYKVIYDKQFSEYPKFEFVINGQNLTEINSNKNQNYIIENLGENTFRLKLLEKQTDSLTDLQQKLMSYANPYYEITDCKNDTIEFTMRVNLHVISHSGKFIRID